jgi:hypothetical protein
VVLDPLAVDADVAFVEMESRPAQKVLDVVGAKVHAVNLVLPLARSRSLRALPMKPLAPRIRTLFFLAALMRAPA